MAVLTAASVCYLALVAVLSVMAALGVPLEPAARTGHVVGRVCAVLVVGADLVTLARGHRPSDTPTHVAYAVCAVALPWVLTSRWVTQGERTPSLWVVALAAAATAVVLVRLAQTWS